MLPTPPGAALASVEALKLPTIIRPPGHQQDVTGGTFIITE